MKYNPNYIVFSCKDDINLGRLDNLLRLEAIFYYTKITNDKINYYMRIVKDKYEEILFLLTYHKIKFSIQLGLFNE